MPRKQNTIHYLYKTTCLVTGRYYIGMHSTSNLDDGYLGSGIRLRRSIRKYGKENHVKEIIEFFDCREVLIEAEKRAITGDMLDDTDCMNLMSGGTGGLLSKIHHEKMIQGSINWLNDKWKDESFKKIVTETSRKNILKLHGEGKFKNNKRFLNKVHSEKSKRLIGDKMKDLTKGSRNSQYGTCWITKDGINKKIKNEEVNLFVKDGWIKGRKI
jgi:hypothetical protein